MKKYRVHVDRASYGSTVIEVVSRDMRGARENALSVAGDYEFRECDCDYNVTNVEEVEQDGTI